MIYIIRHGQTDQNVAHRIQGQAEFPMNETGEAQAAAARDELAARGIAFDRVYSSPLTRALDTARIVAGEAVETVLDDRLLEIDFGPYEGVDLTDMPEELKFFFKDFINHPAPKGVEQLEDLKARLGAFLEDVKRDLLAGGGADRNVLISTHAIALKAAMEYLDPEAHGRWWMTFVKNCAVYAFDIVDGKFTVPVEVI